MVKIKREPLKSKFKPQVVSAGTHNAIFVGVWPIGKHESEYLGEKKIQEKIILQWEVDELITDDESDFKGKRKHFIQRMTLSLFDRAPFKKIKDSMCPECPDDSFDTDLLIGLPCLVSVVHKKTSDGQKTYTNLVSVSQLLKGMEPLKPEVVYEEPPEWVQKIRAQAIEGSTEGDIGPSAPDGPGGPKIVNLGDEKDEDEKDDDDDDVPF